MADYQDVWGAAMLDFLKTGKEDNIIVRSPDFDDDVIPIQYLFRKYEDMPEIEKKALRLCRGKVLDLGAGAGCHSLFLTNNGFDVVSVDSSEGSIETMKKRGLKNVVKSDAFVYLGDKFDTILLLMNGIGISGTPFGYGVLLSHLKDLLLPGGQIIFDSTDIKYLFDKPVPHWLKHLNDDYYGIVRFQISYKNLNSEPFDWLYIDKRSAKTISNEVGFSFELIFENKVNTFLARLTMN